MATATPLDDRLRDFGLRKGRFAYYDPVCGNLAVGLHVLELYKPSEAHIADESPDVVNFFCCLTHQYARLVARVRELVGNGLDDHGHHALQRRFNERKDAPPESAAQFCVLSRGTCVDGLRVVTPAMWAHLHRAHRVLSQNKVFFECVGADAFLRRRRPEESALVHADPCDRKRLGPALDRWAAAGARVLC